MTTDMQRPPPAGPPPLRFLIADSEPHEARDRRRASVGRSSGETFVDVLLELAPGAACDRVTPADDGAALPDVAALADYDAVFLSGSPLHLYEPGPEARCEVEFMQAVFASGTPSFGSCAGLQLATIAVGGSVRPMRARREAGFARRLAATAEGRDHPMLRGRPASWEAPAIHTDEVETLPDDATLLACNDATQVQAAEIRHRGGIFWGVQYHPELSLHEVAQALRRQAADLIEHGLGRSEADVASVADLVETLGQEPGRIDLPWRLGLDPRIVDPHFRRIELRNFLDYLVAATRRERGRAD